VVDQRAVESELALGTLAEVTEGRAAFGAGDLGVLTAVAGRGRITATAGSDGDQQQ
jgi:hypothetical protein